MIIDLIDWLNNDIPEYEVCDSVYTIYGYVWFHNIVTITDTYVSIYSMRGLARPFYLEAPAFRESRERALIISNW